MRRRLLCAALLLGSMFATGCSRNYTVTIESDGCWNGIINGETLITGCSNARYKITGQLKCARLAKDAANGYLRVRIDSGPWAETTADKGVVQVCN